MSPLGKRIDTLRREHDWTWKALARRAGLHPQGLYKITHGERHDPRMSAMVGLAKAFAMTVSEMLGPLEATMTTPDDEEEDAA
jgi:transcriptional regulator with XRE-family HTH domain